MDIQAVCVKGGMGNRVISPWADWPVGAKSFLLSQLPGLFQFSVSLFEYFLVSAVQLVHRLDITNGAVINSRT